MDRYAFSISLLTVVTAVVHLYLGISEGMVMFILNGLGYLALLGALYLPLPQLAGRQRTITWLLMGFAALTIILWVLFGARTPIGVFDKVVEVMLVIVIWMQIRASKATT